MTTNNRKILAIAKEGKTPEEQERYEDVMLRLVHGEGSINLDKDETGAAARLMNRIERSKAYQKEEREVLQIANHLGMSDIFDYGLTERVKDKAIKYGSLKRMEGMMQSYRGLVNLDGVEMSEGRAKFFNAPPISEVLGATIRLDFDKAYSLVTAPGRNASGSEEAQRVLNSLNTEVYSPLVQSVDQSAENFSMASSELILMRTAAKGASKVANIVA